MTRRRTNLVRFPFLKNILAFFKGYHESVYEIVKVESEEDIINLYNTLKEQEREGKIMINSFEILSKEEMMELDEKNKKKLR